MTDGLDKLFEGRPEILSVQEVSTLLGMGKAGVYKWLHEGSMPGYQKGKSWFIIRDEFKDWMRTGSNQLEGQRITGQLSVAPKDD